MATINGLPVYSAQIDGDDLGMMRVSLVDAPAVMTDFIAMEGQREQVRFAVKDEEKRLVWGVLMRADFPIYRRDKSKGEYYVIYTAETIRAMAQKYLAEGRANRVNLMHEDGTEVQGVEMVQLVIQDKERGIVPTGFGDDIADGSLFAEYHVENDEVWEAIKRGEYKGFSLEGYFEMAPATQEEAETAAQSENFSQSKDNKFMSKMKQIFAALAGILAQFGRIATENGVLIWDGEEDLKAGDAVFTENEDGERSPAADGEYRTDDGKVIVVANGVVSEIRDAEAEVAPEESAEEQENAEEAPAEEAPAEEQEEDIEARLSRIESTVQQLLDLLGVITVEHKAMKAEISKPAAEPTAEQYKKLEKENEQPTDRRCRKALSIR